MSETVTEFKLRVLKAIGKDIVISGDKMVAYVAAARRLERKGFARKEQHWYVTKAGKELLEAAPPSKEE